MSASPNFCSNETCLILVSLASATRPTEPPSLVKLCNLPHLLAHTCVGKLPRFFCYCPCPSSAPKWNLAFFQPGQLRYIIKNFLLSIWKPAIIGWLACFLFGSEGVGINVMNEISQVVLLVNKRRVRLPNRMNFRKNSKRPSTPPPSFSENYVANFLWQTWLHKCEEVWWPDSTKCMHMISRDSENSSVLETPPVP